MKYFFLFLVLAIGACSSDDGEDGSENASEACKKYCSLASDICTGDNAIYNDSASCYNACSVLVDQDKFREAQRGNSLQCRLYHVNAANTNPGTHCPHASVASTAGTCQDTPSVCNTYCGIFSEQCPDEFESDFGTTRDLETLQNCLNTCPNKIKIAGEAMSNDTTDTASCRLSQANAGNCSDAQIVSTVCVDPS